MPKDKKKSKSDKKARAAEKQSKNASKALQKEKKARTKTKDGDSDAEDVDLDELLAEYARQQAQYLKVTESVILDPPSARSSATILASPVNKNEVLLFGGESYDGALAVFYNDLYVYQINHDAWRHVTSPNTPLPRSGHAWTRGGNDSAIYLFGGEFSSPKQGTFYHYNDFWRLDPSSREWSKVEVKGKSPPARSGHRMTYWKNFIILFGGFQDTSIHTKYLDDLWLYDTQNFAWHSPKLPPVTQAPEPRSSFSFLPHDNGAALFGGYSRVKSVGKRKKGKDGSVSQQSFLKPVIHQDSWYLRIAAAKETTSAANLPTVRWERRKRPFNSPNPSRAGATMSFHKGRGILFGGVHDVEESEEGIESEFFNELFTWNVEKNRWFKSTLRKPRAVQKMKGNRSEGGGRQRGRAKAGEEDLLRNLASIERNDGGPSGDQMVDELSDEEDEASAIQKPISFEFPHPRFNAQLAVQGDILLIYGGTYERGDKEFTLDEFHSIDLGKLDGVKELFHRRPANWTDSDEEMSDEADDDSEEDSEDEGSVMDLDLKDDQEHLETSSLTTAITSFSLESDSVIEEEPMQPSASTLPYPRPFESLREFYSRSVSTWQDLILNDDKGLSVFSIASQGIKEVRKEAFKRAEQRYWDVREEVREEEDKQEEAGIGEVVNLEARAEGLTGGRRR